MAQSNPLDQVGQLDEVIENLQALDATEDGREALAMAQNAYGTPP